MPRRRVSVVGPADRARHALWRTLDLGHRRGWPPAVMARRLEARLRRLEEVEARRGPEPFTRDRITFRAAVDRRGELRVWAE